jgi:hypothetical protein
VKHPCRTPLHWVVMVTQLSAALVRGCHSWHVVTVKPEQLIEVQHPKVVRVDLVAGRRIDVVMPAIRDDTLYGRVAAKTVAIPLHEVRAISVKRGSFGKSVALGFGILAGALVGFVALLAATWN